MPLFSFPCIASNVTKSFTLNVPLLLKQVSWIVKIVAFVLSISRFRQNFFEWCTRLAALVEKTFKLNSFTFFPRLIHRFGLIFCFNLFFTIFFDFLEVGENPHCSAGKDSQEPSNSPPDTYRPVVDLLGSPGQLLGPPGGLLESCDPLAMVSELLGLAGPEAAAHQHLDGRRNRYLQLDIDTLGLSLICRILLYCLVFKTSLTNKRHIF